MQQHHRNHSPVHINHLQNHRNVKLSETDEQLSELGIQELGSKGELKEGLINYPIAGLDEADEPEKYIDVEEEEGVGQEERVVVAP